MKTKKEIFTELLNDKVTSEKPVILRYLKRHELCRHCPDRLKCLTKNYKACIIRKDVDKHLDKTKQFFKVLFK